MQPTLLFFSLLLVRAIESFVYSCDEVKYQLMNTGFEQTTQYAYVVVQESYSSLEVLNNVFLQKEVKVGGVYQMLNITFGSIAFRLDEPEWVNKPVNNTDHKPWKIVGDNEQVTCDQEFTLILTSDETKIERATVPPRNPNARYFSGESRVFVVPQVGMWFNKYSMAGDGNFTVYTGAGNGEEEERYELQSWPCDSVPDWIFLFQVVVTIEVDDSCSFQMERSSDYSFEFTIYRNDRFAVLVSGRSDNLQNRNSYAVRMKIEDEERANVTLAVDISLDSANTMGMVDIVKRRSGEPQSYQNGTSTENFISDYLEVHWDAYHLIPSQVSNNNDYVNIDIQVSPWNEAMKCPEGYSLMTSVDDEHWCFHVKWPLPPKLGFNFLESFDICASENAWLPIVTSDEMNIGLRDFAQMHRVFDSVWLGLVCDTETDLFTWQDGQSLEYDNFLNTTIHPIDLGMNCSSESGHIGIDYATATNYFGHWRSFESQRQFGMCICATRPVATTTQEPTTTPFKATTTGPTTSTVLSTAATANPSPISTWTIVIIVISCILIVGGFILVILIARRRIQSLRAKMIEEQLAKKVADPSQKARSRYYDVSSRTDWEIERRFVSIDSSRKLGEGAFGSVFVGRVLAKNIPLGVGRSIAELSALTNNNDTVAVKLLHENADAQREAVFRAEIDLMKKIGYHERLVNLLACVTSSIPILLICEYCANGDLLHFLRHRRTFMLENSEDLKAPEVITVKKQLMFAIQISYGMEFLSTQGFIHRDLAARNVMVDQQESCKIGDFGLARLIEDESENYHAQGGKLPLKWMSPEAIDKFIFSTATDVWSFGVLLFEIVTLGGSPYAGWPAAELLTRLKRGERMEKPDNCSEDLYEMMLGCWSEKPHDRPTFTELRQHIGDLLEDINQDDYYLKLNAHAHYYVLESNPSE